MKKLLSVLFLLTLGIQLQAQDSCSITAFPYHESFENSMFVNNCWTIQNSNNYGWQQDLNDSELTHTGSGMMISFSQYLDNYDNMYDLNPNNWLISPSLQLPTSSSVLASWYDNAYYFGNEQYSLYISTTGTNTTDFTLVGTYNAYDWWGRKSVDLSAYAGQTVHIAFRHTDGSYVLLLDDLRVEAGRIVNVSCTGNGYGSVLNSDDQFNGNLCGQTEIRNPGFLASYDFLPGEGCSMAHLYVNNVDRINDVVTHTSGTSVSYYTYAFYVTDSVTYLNPVFNYPSYDVTVNCTGDGLGYVYNSNTYDRNLCGEVDEVRQGFYASYDFYPSSGNEMTHLYVNGVDRIADAYAHTYGSYSSTGGYYSYSFPANANATMEPVFERLTYTVTATVNNPSMGMVTGGGTYYYDSLVSITATSMPHYHLHHWIVTYDGDVTAQYDSAALAEFGMEFNPLQFDCFGDIAVTAVFAPEQYTITVEANNVTYGSVSGSGTFDYLQPVTVSATAFSGYRFLMWDNGSTYNPYTFPATEDLTLTAIFASDDDTSSYFYITVSANDTTMGEVEGGGIYQMGESATLTATAYEGFRFVQWNDGSTDNPRTIIITSNNNYIAYFAEATGIGEIDADAVKVYCYGDCIFVGGAKGRDVNVFDISGRLLSHISSPQETIVFNMQHSGVYIVTVGATAHRVVVISR